MPRKKKITTLADATQKQRQQKVREEITLAVELASSQSRHMREGTDDDRLRDTLREKTGLLLSLASLDSAVESNRQTGVLDKYETELKLRALTLKHTAMDRLYEKVFDNDCSARELIDVVRLADELTNDDTAMSGGESALARASRLAAKKVGEGKTSVHSDYLISKSDGKESH